MTQMPLNDRDFAEIRANVMREIERRRTRNVWVAGAAFAFAVLALVFVLIPREPVEGRAPSPARPRVIAASPRAGEGARPSTFVSPRATVVAIKTRKHHHHHHPQPQTAVASAEPLTIELQTANPDIRIIWIAK
jgi:hypothetical protein